MIKYIFTESIDVACLFSTFVDRETTKENALDEEAYPYARRYLSYVERLEQGYTIVNWLAKGKLMVIELRNGSPVALIPGPRESKMIIELRNQQTSCIFPKFHLKGE